MRHHSMQAPLSQSYSIPLTPPTRVVRGPIKERVWEENECFLCRNSSYSFIASLVGTKLHALRGNYHGLLFSFLLSIYQIGRDTQRSGSGRVYAVTVVTHQQEVPLKGRVMIIKRKLGSSLKRNSIRNANQEKFSSEQCMLVVFPCSKCMRDLQFCLTCFESTLILTFKCSFPPSTLSVLHTQRK